MPFREIAEVIGRQLKLAVVGTAVDEAGDHFGFLSAMVSFDNPTSSAPTQQRLGWRLHGAFLIGLKGKHLRNRSGTPLYRELRENRPAPRVTTSGRRRRLVAVNVGNPSAARRQLARSRPELGRARGQNGATKHVSVQFP